MRCSRELSAPAPFSEASPFCVSVSLRSVAAAGRPPSHSSDSSAFPVRSSSSSRSHRSSAARSAIPDPPSCRRASGSTSTSATSYLFAAASTSASVTDIASLARSPARSLARARACARALARARAAENPLLPGRSRRGAAATSPRARATHATGWWIVCVCVWGEPDAHAVAHAPCPHLTSARIDRARTVRKRRQKMVSQIPKIAGCARQFH